MVVFVTLKPLDEEALRLLVCKTSFYSPLMIANCADNHRYSEEMQPFDEEQNEIVAALREHITIILGKVTQLDIANVCERSCFLYACMIATANSSRDDKTLQLWRQCYKLKILQIHELLTNQMPAQM